MLRHTVRHTVRHVSLSWRTIRRPRCSRRICAIAHQHARVVVGLLDERPHRAGGVYTRRPRLTATTWKPSRPTGRSQRPQYDPGAPADAGRQHDIGSDIVEVLVGAGCLVAPDPEGLSPYLRRSTPGGSHRPTASMKSRFAAPLYNYGVETLR
jgi:hypothetical protein